MIYSVDDITNNEYYYYESNEKTCRINFNKPVNDVILDTKTGNVFEPYFIRTKELKTGDYKYCHIIYYKLYCKVDVNKIWINKEKEVLDTIYVINQMDWTNTVSIMKVLMFLLSIIIVVYILC